MRKCLIVAVALVAAVGLSACAGKAPIGKGKAPVAVVTKG